MKRPKGWSKAALLALLATIALLNRYRVHESLLDHGQCGRNLQTLAHAVERYAADHHGRPPGRLDQLLPEHLRAVPRCPASQRQSYAIFAGFTAPLGGGNPNAYYLFCHGNSHPGYQRDFPAYSNTQGLLGSLARK